MEILLKDIWIDRATRQRKEIVIDDLIESIPRHGVLVPIIVVKEEGPAGQPYKLLAGERRYTASRKIGNTTIPTRLLSDLSPFEQRIVELEENMRRKDLGWQDQCLAMASLHDVLTKQAGSIEWSFTKTADHLGYSAAWVQRCCRVAKELHRENVRNMESATRAYNFISREDERVASDAISNILHSATTAANEAIDEASGSDPLDDILNASTAPENPGNGPSLNGPAKSAKHSPLSLLPSSQSFKSHSSTGHQPTPTSLLT